MLAYLQAIDLQELSLITVFVRIVLSILIGGIIGYERDARNQAAGFRTYIIVCMGATLIMMTNQFAAQEYGFGDPTRMAAQVVSGIGFLGAGTIMVTNTNHIKGLTTAAGLWTAAGIGLAIGIGFYSGAIIGALALLVTITVLHSFKGRIRDLSNMVQLYIRLDDRTAYHRMVIFLAKQGVNILEITTAVGLPEDGLEEKNGGGEVSYFVTIYLPDKTDSVEVLDNLTRVKGVQKVEVI